MSKITIDKNDLQSRDKKITEQQDEIMKLREQLASGEGGGSGGGSNQGSAFTKEDQEVLGELYEPMKKLVEASVGGLAANINKNFSGVTDSIKSLQDNIENQNKSLFSGVASTTLKNYSEIKDTQEFKDFLETEVEGVGITWGDAWADAEAKNDIKRLQQIINRVPAPEKEDAEGAEEEESNFEPTGGSSTKEMKMSPNFKFKASDLQAKVDEYKEGAIDIDTYEKFEKDFYEAVDNGQVINDVEEN